MEGRFLTLSQESRVASEVYRTVDPLNFYKAFLTEGIRPDGRKLNYFRKPFVRDLLNSNPCQITPTTSTDSGKGLSLLVSSIYFSSGNSQYCCKLTGEFLEFDEMSDKFEDSDLFNVDVNLPKHVVNEVYDLNGPCINATHIVSNLIQQVLNSEKIIPQSQFLYHSMLSQNHTVDDIVLKFVKNSRFKWRFNMEITCDEYDGNLLDNCFLCCSYSLLYSKLQLILFSQIPNSSSMSPTLLTKSVMDSNRELVNLNQNFLLLQLGNPDPSDLLDLLNIGKFYTSIKFNYLPFTFTFCKCLDYFILDPTRDDEQVGVNFSIYALKKYNSNDIKLQPLNIMGLDHPSDDTLEKMYKISKTVLQSF